ncbi:hypothetical protein H5410_045394 [Solanum commersonii]|uniref:Uncharacterized protein n=1 Tax=Solanum commersonii TaxID=4109 RepID=A0A9J5XDJ9_SOLCO|nr:hypothetical protein H5410_045394 [Solanum commersonii]
MVCTCLVASFPQSSSPNHSHSQVKLPLSSQRPINHHRNQVIQALKRAQRTDPSQIEAQDSKTLNRLIKTDLIATYKELLRQDLCNLALKVLPAIQLECDVPDLGLYANMVLALTRRKVGTIECDDKSLVRLVRVLVEGEHVESTIRVYELLKKNGWGSRFEIDEYVAKVLRRGFKRFGKEEMVDGVRSIITEIVEISLGETLNFDNFH